MAEIRQTEDDIKDIICLFSTEICETHDPGKDYFIHAIKLVQKSYRPSDFDKRKPVNFEIPAIRCAYVHKYASIHAAIIQKVLLEDLSSEQRGQIFRVESEVINVCSLGAGPCCDVVGVLAALARIQQPVQVKFTSIDISTGWKIIHDDVLRFLTSGTHQSLGEFYSSHGESTFVDKDILDPSDETLDAIKSSDMIIMTKFVSELTNDRASRMVQNVLELMKPDAILLFVDNSVGGYLSKVQELKEKYHLNELFMKEYEEYKNVLFHEVRHGMASLLNDGLNVSIGVWKKEPGDGKTA